MQQHEMLPSLEMPAFNTIVLLKVVSTILEQSFQIKTMSPNVTSVKHINSLMCQNGTIYKVWLESAI